MQMQTSFTGKKMSGTKNLFQRLFVTPWKRHEPSSDSSIPDACFWLLIVLSIVVLENIVLYKSTFENNIKLGTITFENNVGTLAGFLGCFTFEIS
ncbi:hypothetical protein Goklo_022861 [Gossypium klotzschianum]|uniref:Uncharacterized protein n=1 Tax=Gossypium klotzschianum TaxID=34286 RepID=A0A7J8TP06_9ROSI|nr:hypothetical protein [Gossypium klotzschianum]